MVAGKVNSDFTDSIQQLTCLWGLFSRVQEGHSPRPSHSQNLFVLEEIWDALKAAAEADLTLAQAIIDSAGVIVQHSDLTVCYDERGAKYELPSSLRDLRLNDRNGSPCFLIQLLQQLLCTSATLIHCRFAEQRDSFERDWCFRSTPAWR
ncbi:hypothetical protein L6164_031761 [Bauhinia variegata]|uniref:Uncharacterized protein n=1 Tax=Bauhinia variegata TaxID=167791 RepID=A0ACB9KLL4_BAUVA|nr:hypothetical protein L6164_031761 [Bauhinia variegata]